MNFLCSLVVPVILAGTALFALHKNCLLYTSRLSLGSSASTKVGMPMVARLISVICEAVTG